MIKGIAIDADYLIFECTESRDNKGSYFTAEDGFEDKEYKKPLKPFKDKFKDSLGYLLKEIFASLPGEFTEDLDIICFRGLRIPKDYMREFHTKHGYIKLCFSDPKGNFRTLTCTQSTRLIRKGERSKEFYRLRKWALKEYGYPKGFEADDEVAHLVRDKGYLGASMDKDLLGTEGTWFDTYHSRRHIVKTTKEEAAKFVLLQTLAGDPTDNIKGIPRVGMATAHKLLDEFGWDMRGAIKAYESKGLTEYDAILNRRLVDMHQYDGKELQLWVKD